jgi:hypothetical protein
VNKKNPQFSVAKKDQKRIREGLDEGLDADQIDVSEAREIGQNIVDSTANAMNAAAEASSPAKRFVRIGENIVNSTAMGMEGEAAEQQGKPSLPGNLAPPPPPATSEVEQSRAGKLFSSLKGKAATVGNKAMDMALETGPGKKVANYFAETSGADITNSQGKVVSTLHQEIKELGDAADRAADQVEENTQAVKENGKASSGMAKGDTAVDSDGNPIIGPDGKPLTNKQIQNESKRQKRQKRAGVAAGIMGTATMAVGMATQVDAEILGFNVGELAQKFMPLIGAVAILGPMLLAMSGPVALVVLALVGIGAAYMAYQAQLKKVTEAARELGESLGSGSKAMGRFAEFAGTATATEIMNRKRQLGSIDVAIGKSEFGESYMASEEGKAYVEEVKKGFEELGKSETIKKLGAQLSTAVISGVLTAEQAAGIASELGRAIGDTSVSIGILGNLTELIGPGGEDILTNPLEVKMRVLQVSAEGTYGEGGTVQSLMSSITDPENVEGLRGFIDAMFTTPELQAQLAGELVALAGQRQELLDADSVAFDKRIAALREEESTLRQQGKTLEANQKLSEIDAATAQFWSDRQKFLEESNISVNAITDQYSQIVGLQEKIENVGNINYLGKDDMEPIRQVLKDYESLTGTSFDFDIDSGTMKQLKDAFREIDTGELDKMGEALEGTFDQIGELVKSNFENSSDSVKTTVANLVEAINDETRGMSIDLRLNLLTGLQTGTFDVGQVKDFVQKYVADSEDVTDDAIEDYRENRERTRRGPGKTDEEIAERIATEGRKMQENFNAIVEGLGSGAGQQLFSVFDKVEDTTERLLSNKLADAINIGDPEAIQDATNLLDVVSGIATYGEGTIDVDAAINVLVSNPEALADFNSKMKTMDALLSEYGEDLTAELTFGTIFETDSVGFNALNSQAEYFNGLPSSQQKLFVSTFVTQFITGMESIGTAEGDATVSEFKAGEIAGLGSLGGGVDGRVGEIVSMTDEEVFAEIARRAAERVTNALIAAGVIDGLEIDPGPSGAGAEPQIDSLLKKLRDLRDGTIEMKKGWEGMQKVLQSVFQGGTTSMNMFDGLSNQIRSIAGFSVGEGLIEYIVGMDPDEYEKRKNELFIFENGNIVGVTGALKNLQSAFNAIAVGEYVNTQEKSISNIQDQIDAIKILTTNGLTYAESLKIVQDQEIATAIAKGATQAEINKTIEVTRELMNLRGDMEKEEKKSAASEAVRKTNKDFEQREKLLKKLATTAGQYSDAQISAILNDSNLQELFLEPSIDQDAFDQAIANAELSAEVELQIKLSTVEGMKSVIDEGLSKAMEAFAAQEQEIELNFQLDIANDESIIRSAESAISAIQFEIDDLQADLTRIGRQEEEINEAYDRRIDALEKTEKLNQQIASAQKSQLDIADALSRGDIAAAARAIQQAREERAKAAAQSQKERLERAREIQLGKIVGNLGLTREQLEDQIKDLEEQVFNLEEDLLEPAQERIRLAQELRDEQVRSLEVLGKTRDEWDRIRNNVDLAQANSSKFVSSIQNALDNVEKLIEALGPLADQASGTSGTNASSGGAVGMSGGGMIIPKRMAMGGRVKGYRMGGLIPYKANGGFFRSLGSDTIPAMLTPGEFVVRRPAVKDFGVDNLESINRGTYSSGSVYNYNLNVNVKSDSNANDIARTVIAQIKRVDSQRIRGNRF